MLLDGVTINDGKDSLAGVCATPICIDRRIAGTCAARVACRQAPHARGRAGDQRTTPSHPAAQSRGCARMPVRPDSPRRGGAACAPVDQAERRRPRAPARVEKAPVGDQRPAPDQAVARLACSDWVRLAKRAPCTSFGERPSHFCLPWAAGH